LRPARRAREKGSGGAQLPLVGGRRSERVQFADLEAQELETGIAVLRPLAERRKRGLRLVRGARQAPDLGPKLPGAGETVERFALRLRAEKGVMLVLPLDLDHQVRELLEGRERHGGIAQELPRTDGWRVP